MSDPRLDPRIDIAETVYRFAYGIDQRDWIGYRSIFVAPPQQIDFDYSSYHGRPPSSMDVDTWVGALTPLFTGLDATQHTMSNPLVEIDGAEARCRVYMQAAHFLWRDDLDGHDRERRSGVHARRVLRRPPRAW